MENNIRKIIEEEPETLLAEYDFDYNTEERRLFWNVTNPPMLKQKTIIFSVVCFAIALIVGILNKSITFVIGMCAIGIIWSLFPCLIYLIRYRRYCKQTSNLWNNKWKIEIYDGHINMTGESLNEDKRAISHSVLYDDIYKIVNVDNRVYLIPGSKSMIIMDKKKTSKNIINAILELDILTQEGPRE